jgi:hypothetical protein
MVNISPTLLHDFFQVAIGNSVSHIEINRLQDYAFRIIGSLEINRHPMHPVACLFENHVARSANKQKVAKVCDRTLRTTRPKPVTSARAPWTLGLGPKQSYKTDFLTTYQTRAVLTRRGGAI